MNTDEFWDLIERTWKETGRNEVRLQAVDLNRESLLEVLIGFIETDFLAFYRAELKKLNKQEFTSYIHLLEEKLYQIDRSDIHEYIGGSDDGFLYGRCFIVGMGKEYFDMIDQNPIKGLDNMDAERFGFTAYILYEEIFDEEFDRNSIHCIESCSNEAAWKL